jgi:hypothetical protein
VSILEDYEPERRPVALDYVDKITTANKRKEAADPAERKSWTSRLWLRQR